MLKLENGKEERRKKDDGKYSGKLNFDERIILYLLRRTISLCFHRMRTITEARSQRSCRGHRRGPPFCVLDFPDKSGRIRDEIDWREERSLRSERGGGHARANECDRNRRSRDVNGQRGQSESGIHSRR